MKFLIDAQLPRSLAQWLKQQGHDALHTLDLPEANRTSDQRIMEIADTELRVVVTKDADFVSSFELRATPKRLLLISTGNITNAALLELWVRNIDAITAELSQARFVELSASQLTVRG